MLYHASHPQWPSRPPLELAPSGSQIERGRLSRIFAERTRAEPSPFAAAVSLTQPAAVSRHSRQSPSLPPPQQRASSENPNGFTPQHGPSRLFLFMMSKRELKDLGPALAYRPTHRGPTVTARVSTGPPAPRKKEAVADVNKNKRPRRAAADAATGALDGADTAVAELKDVHASQSIALTSHDALAAMLWPAHTVVVTLHTSERAFVSAGRRGTYWCGIRRPRRL